MISGERVKDPAQALAYLQKAEKAAPRGSPMATIIVGGLISSTILNLLILPTIMLHFGRFEKTATFELGDSGVR